MKQVLAIVSGDWHLNLWSKFNDSKERTINQFRVLSLLNKKALDTGSRIIFTGDLFEKPDNLSNELLGMLGEWMNTHEIYAPLFGISGNHDISQVSNVGIKPISWINSLSNLYPSWHSLDYTKYQVKRGNGECFNFYGIPYIDHNRGIGDYIKSIVLDKSQKNILVVHTDYPGATDTDGREIGTGNTITPSMFRNFDLVLSGHIHKPQRLSKRFQMVGAPIQMRRTDRNCEMGYYILYDDLTLTFKNLSSKFPKFIDVEKKEDIFDDGNYYTVIPTTKSSESKIGANGINISSSKSSLAINYCRSTGIRDKKKRKLLTSVLNKTEND